MKPFVAAAVIAASVAVGYQWGHHVGEGEGRDNARFVDGFNAGVVCKRLVRDMCVSGARTPWKNVDECKDVGDSVVKKNLDENKLRDMAEGRAR